MKIFLISVIFIFASAVASAGEWNEKPVMCASGEATFSAIALKGEVLIGIGDQLTIVRDPDEPDGMSNSPAILPWALYANLDAGTYTVVEYHKAPYDVYCIIGFGKGFQFVEEGLKLRSSEGQ